MIIRFLFVWVFLLVGCSQLNLIGPLKDKPNALTSPNDKTSVSIKRNTSKKHVTLAENKTTSKTKSQSNKSVSKITTSGACTQQTFIKHKKRALRSLNKGWAATKAERFGVGFRDEAEYKKWKQTLGIVFKNTASACERVKQCDKKAGKNKKSKCKTLNNQFQRWKKAAKEFTNKIKVVEFTQPEFLCSIKPALDDESRCYQKRSNNIDKICRTNRCKELSNCWKGLVSTDEGVRQAESSCRYLFTDLNQCNAYVVITDRRKEIFLNCLTMDQKYKLNIRPPL